MIYTRDIFNSSTLNIFTDASIIKKDDNFIGCAGAIAATHPDDSGIIKSHTKILCGSTNNHSEINAISMGVDLALEFRNNFTTINLFSDSKLCIYGLREWIFQWINRTGQSNTLVGSYGQEISNQDIIMEIIYKILDNNLSITFYHQTGHVSLNGAKSLNEAKRIFMQINRVKDDIDLDAIRSISYMNNYIDNLTRLILKNTKVFPISSENLISFFYKPFDIEKYAKLIHVV